MELRGIEPLTSWLPVTASGLSNSSYYSKLLILLHPNFYILADFTWFSRFWKFFLTQILTQKISGHTPPIQQIVYTVTKNSYFHLPYSCKLILNTEHAVHTVSKLSPARFQQYLSPHLHTAPDDDKDAVSRQQYPQYKISRKIYQLTILSISTVIIFGYSMYI